MEEPECEILCVKCEEPLDIPVDCFCGAVFCEECFLEHLEQRRKKGLEGGHGRPQSQADILWRQAKEAPPRDNPGDAFLEDEKAKWFGCQLQICDSDTKPESTEAYDLVETPRLRRLIAQSLSFTPDSPSTQFPTLVSFVGGTGTGKSLLIRYLILLSGRENEAALDRVQKPVTADPSSFQATTGEVNLYADPSTFGTATPMFFLDCEGLDAAMPLAHQFQKAWNDIRKAGRTLFRMKRRIDRNFVVENLYPRLVYIFSDVVCYVARENHWPQTISRLMEWSTTGAQHSINQAALPALILIINRGNEGREEWVTDKGHHALTKSFLEDLRDTVDKDPTLAEMARKYNIPLDNAAPSSGEKGPTRIEQLLLKSYSSFHVHFIPNVGSGKLGSRDVILEQISRLQRLIKVESERVQVVRERSQTKFNNRQLLLITGYAFGHISQNCGTPFDFGVYQQLTDMTQSLQTHVISFLKICFERATKANTSAMFEAVTAFLASAIVKKAQSSKNQAVIELHVFPETTRELFKEAMEIFLERHALCSYVNKQPYWRCSNTKRGHDKGLHQNRLNILVASGNFEAGLAKLYNSDEFTNSIKAKIEILVAEAAASAGSDSHTWYSTIETKHRQNIAALRIVQVYPIKETDGTSQQPELDLIDRITNPVKHLLSMLIAVHAEFPFLGPKFCFGCLFGRSEYRLPCSHMVCIDCLKGNSIVSPLAEPKATVVLNECIICGDSGQEKGWPFVIPIPPDLTNPRVLALDGAGARAITQLVVLERLETLIGLGLPIGWFFDLIVGSSAGGIVALGIGSQGFSAKDFVTGFKRIFKEGFVPKLFTKSPGLQWISRWLSKSIYVSEKYEEVVKEELQRGQAISMFGLRNHCRVAVTATAGLDCQLIANYHVGEEGTKYTDSMMTVWTAAQCTSAAPLYFMPKLEKGIEFRDGGLKANNPVLLALDEAKYIWGEVRPDLVLSIGTGKGISPQPQPIGTGIIDYKLVGLFKTWLNTMNGEEAWEEFCTSEKVNTNMLARCNRLNVDLNGNEPTFDDIQEIESMELAARAYNKNYTQDSDTPYKPILGACENPILEVQAGILRASQYFFQITQLSLVLNSQQEKFLIVGTLKCRLGPQETEPFQLLLHMTSYFAVNGKRDTDMNDDLRALKLFEVPLEFTHTTSSGPIRIDVNFGDSYLVAISGFPMDVQASTNTIQDGVLRDYCARNGIEETEVAEDSLETIPSTFDAEGEAHLGG
ncbi:hypothetical protein TWF192_001403 [Orbilia oligospora]|uniref:Uncharacterized protein n=1 Tax=Orbilia oligospora TaxID=2813651 RepID=A0A6G1MFZ6_ORBOL|nr:hypothetical protein TWF191_005947 [Orbilia oligospora]KAF3257124.1 hypothetical protein TWF192_001403 [Orbilia oligospora]